MLGKNAAVFPTDRDDACVTLEWADALLPRKCSDALYALKTAIRMHSLAELEVTEEMNGESAAFARQLFVVPEIRILLEEANRWRTNRGEAVSCRFSRLLALLLQ